MDADRYLIAASGPEVEHKVKGSRFLGQVFPALDWKEAERHLKAVRKRYYDATHHCWAARVGSPLHVEKRSDDNGEPSGTAGMPILLPLERADWYAALIVVTRYYGGTKLGTGGLVKAYGEAARTAMDAVTPRERFLSRTISVNVPFEDLGTVETLLGKRTQSILSLERVFEERPLFRIEVKSSQVESLGRALTEATAGRAQVIFSSEPA